MKTTQEISTAQQLHLLSEKLALLKKKKQAQTEMLNDNLVPMAEAMDSITLATTQLNAQHSGKHEALCDSIHHAQNSFHEAMRRLKEAQSVVQTKKNQEKYTDVPIRRYSKGYYVYVISGVAVLSFLLGFVIAAGFWLNASEKNKLLRNELRNSRIVQQNYDNVINKIYPQLTTEQQLMLDIVTDKK